MPAGDTPGPNHWDQLTRECDLPKATCGLIRVFLNTSYNSIRLQAAVCNSGADLALPIVKAVIVAHGSRATQRDAGGGAP